MIDYKRVILGVFIGLVLGTMMVLALNSPKTYEYNMPMKVGYMEEHEDLFALLRNAGPKDTIVIRTGGFGGIAVTGIAIMEAIRESKAYIIMDVRGPVYSAHSLMLCTADEVHMSQGTLVMFHTLQARKGPILWDKADRGDRIMIKHMVESCARFFSTEEALAMAVRGVDIYRTKEEIDQIMGN